MTTDERPIAIRSNEQLADDITRWAGRIAAGEAELLTLIAEFDRREAWGGPGLLSCAHWLSWKLGMGLKAAHERVRVARALDELPLIAEAYAAGQLSWTQVRALTRVTHASPLGPARSPGARMTADASVSTDGPEPTDGREPTDGLAMAEPYPADASAAATAPCALDGAETVADKPTEPPADIEPFPQARPALDEQAWIDLARHASGAQLERLVRGVRRARKIAADEADPESAAQRMRTRISYDEDGTLVLTCRLAAEDGPVLLAALEQARADLDRRRADPSAVGAEADHKAQPTGSGPVEEPLRSGAANDQLTDAPMGMNGIADVAPLVRGFPTKQKDGLMGGHSESSAEDPCGQPAPATLTEALLHVAAGYLASATAGRPHAARQARYRLTAQIDPLSGWGRLADGELLPPAALRNAATPTSRASVARPFVPWAAGNCRRRALPIPRLSRTPTPPSPPRRLLVLRRAYRSGQPGPALSASPHDGSSHGFPPRAEA